MAKEHQLYLGDGVYAIFDGFGVWLHANDHENPTDRVYLEPQVFSALLRVWERWHPGLVIDARHEDPDDSQNAKIEPGNAVPAGTVPELGGAEKGGGGP